MKQFQKLQDYQLMKSGNYNPLLFAVKSSKHKKTITGNSRSPLLRVSFSLVTKPLLGNDSRIKQKHETCLRNSVSRIISI